MRFGYKYLRFIHSSLAIDNGGNHECGGAGLPDCVARGNRKFCDGAKLLRVIRFGSMASVALLLR